ncbi:hypothetical protein EDEG_03273 [Edhazardia aedis USNM 41457]|uniref:Uncharacterized protein n=1 Tax=Edhazardia aedis (strain USNM 41457) TaxID=1003232 RepID=J9DI38_EDHAE|nr:hypothetical protein EDEG_03273 [Edhazardia aedis USNM 41457]|eukprot:EJW02290.1 hypothetical protein EDEG_03273 [Edhazardia aedis USNM 41457]
MNNKFLEAILRSYTKLLDESAEIKSSLKQFEKTLKNLSKKSKKEAENEKPDKCSNCEFFKKHFLMNYGCNSYKNSPFKHSECIKENCSQFFSDSCKEISKIYQNNLENKKSQKFQKEPFEPSEIFL